MLNLSSNKQKGMTNCLDPDEMASCKLSHLDLHCIGTCLYTYADLFVLRFYSSVNPMGSCQARSVYLTTRLLGRLNPLSG